MTEYKTAVETWRERTERIPRDNHQLSNIAHQMAHDVVIANTSDDMRGFADLLRGARYRRLAFAVLANLATRGRMDIQGELLRRLWWNHA